MANKPKRPRKKLPKLNEIKQRIKGKAYVGDGVKELINKRDSLTKERDSLKKKTELQQKDIDSLKQVIKIRVK